MCRVLGVSRSGFYKWLKWQLGKQAKDTMQLQKRIDSIYKDHKGRIGSPKMKKELDAQGVPAGKNRIASYMRKAGLRAITTKKFRGTTTDSKHSLPVAPNILNREFTVSNCNNVWVTDITYVRTRKGWAYLVVFIDLYSRKVVGWAVGQSLATEMVLKALYRAIRDRNPPAGLMIHSDRGCQYASMAFREVLNAYGFVQSMSRKGNCWDNAVAESFFKIYKTEFAYHNDFKDEQEVLHKTFEYVEIYYNRKRRHGSTNYLTPVAYENQFEKVA